MRVSLDGGNTYVEAPQGVLFAYHGMLTPGGEEGAVLIKANEDGVAISVAVGENKESRAIAQTSTAQESH